MAKVHISQFYPCSEVKLACELYYICELGKYLHILHGDELSLDGVVLNSILKKSSIWDFFRLAVDKGWISDTGIDINEIHVTAQSPLIANSNEVTNVLFTTEPVQFSQEEYIKRKTDELYAYENPEVLQVSFSQMDDENWIWGINGENDSCFNINNKAFGHNLAHQRYVSLMAMVAVHRLKYSVPERVILRFDQNTILNSISSLSYILLLSEDEHCLKGWCFHYIDDSVSENRQLQVGYASWYRNGLDIGMLNRYYSPTEKSEYMKKLDIRVGDIVMLYERVRSTKTNYMKEICSCHFAKLLEIKGRDYIFEVSNTFKTKKQGELDYLNKTIAVKRMYGANKGYEDYNHTKVTIDIGDLGIEYMMESEKYFIVPLDSCNDTVILAVSDGSRTDTLALPQNDAIYWILKDYNVEFNEERFLARYFRSQLPLYTRYMNGDDLEDEFYVK